MSERLPSHTGWTVIVGSGIAGLMAALTLAPQPVLLLTRGVLGGETSSAWAQGGIAASLGPDDRATLHLADTLAAGDGLLGGHAGGHVDEVEQGQRARGSGGRGGHVRCQHPPPAGDSARLRCTG